MATLTTTEIIPLETDADGVMRVSQTRVLWIRLSPLSKMGQLRKRSHSNIHLFH